MGNEAFQLQSTIEREGSLNTPLVSIITPVFNSIKYLEICIQSVLSQSYPYIEHVFVDGVSTDGTLDMLASYQAKYPDRIRFMSEPDRGCCDAWNKGWEMARGDIIGWIGSDDSYKPDAIMTIVEFFRANPDAYIVVGNCNEIDERGELIGKKQARDFNLKDALNDLVCLPTKAAFYKPEVIKKVGPMDTSINACDFDFFIKVGKVFQIYRIEKILSDSRTHKGAVSGREGINEVYRREHFMVIRRHGGRILSLYGMRYFMLEAIDRLRPILGPIYPFMYNVYDVLRKRIKLIDRLLEIIFPRRY